VQIWRERAITAILVVAAVVVMVAWRASAGASEDTTELTPVERVEAPTTTRPVVRSLRAAPPTTTTTAPTTTTTSAPPTTTTTTAPPPTTTTAAPPPPRGFRELTRLVLTADGADRYDVTGRDGTIRYDAPTTNQDRNLRVLVWDPTSAPATDQQVCATWTAESDDMDQQGVALRIRQDGTRWRAITVTKNILMAAYSHFNVHTWDSARTTTHPDGRPSSIEMEGSVTLDGMIQEGMVVKPLPWRMCARVVGLQVQLKVWALADGEPTWDDPHHAGTVDLPEGWDIDGRGGWFAGHLDPGGFAESADVTRRALTSAA
jgi:hypothetical protein